MAHLKDFSQYTRSMAIKVPLYLSQNVAEMKRVWNQNCMTDLNAAEHPT